VGRLAKEETNKVSVDRTAGFALLRAKRLSEVI
jgi:hypothetical protein